MFKKVTGLLMLACFLLASASFAAAYKVNYIHSENIKIDSEIFSELGKKDRIDVIILLKDNNLKGLGKEETKQEIRKNQERILKSVSKKDFQLKRRYETLNALAGSLTLKGLNKLKASPHIESIYLDRKAHMMLDKSVPMINADSTWPDADGSGVAVCVLDTGIDYTHPDLGNPGCGTGMAGKAVNFSIESPHNYPDSYNNTWTITRPGFSNIAVHFERVGLEKSRYDYMQILDKNDNIVDWIDSAQKWNASNYCEDRYGIWSVSVPGDTIKIRLVSDSDYSCYGFKIDQVFNGTGSKWSNCGNIAGGYDFVNDDNDPMDDNTHGTHVAGIIASQNSLYKGVAPGAAIVAAKVLDFNGSGSFSDIAAAVEWCTINKDRYNISVISMSLGDETQNNDSRAQCDGYLTAKAIDHAVAENIFVVAAAGNEGFKNGIAYPACVSNATSVGDVYDADVGGITWFSGCTDLTTYPDKIVCHSNRDEILDLVAPGALITSTIPGGFDTYGGTSMATPHIAGAAALLLGKYQGLTPEQLRDTLKKTGINITDPATNLSFPRVDALAAINSLKSTAKISLTKGWNLISVPLILGNMSANSIFENVSYSGIYTYESTGYALVSGNELISISKGYWINANNDYNLTLSGALGYPVTFNLNKGYNLAGYPSIAENNTNYVFGKVNSSINNIFTYDNKNKKWGSYDYNTFDELNTITTVKPGNAYFVNLNKDLNLSFDGRFT